jgi:O-methyltransferase
MMKRPLKERLADFIKATVSSHSERNSSSDQSLLSPPIEPDEAEILFDPAFRASVNQVKDFTCLDIARLANIWMFVRQCGPGVYLEVGSYRGGTARHICNAMPQKDSTFYCVDPFETGGYEHVHDWEQKPAEFTDTRQHAVAALLSDKPFAHVVCGFFPPAIEPLDLQGVVFCHLDVNMYDATKKSLQYLAPRMERQSCIVVDDYGHRNTPGVALAVKDFLTACPDFLAFPIFPCQALLIPRHLW